MKDSQFDGGWWAQALLDWQQRARPLDPKPLTDDRKLTDLGQVWVLSRIADRQRVADKAVARAKYAVDKTAALRDIAALNKATFDAAAQAALDADAVYVIDDAQKERLERADAEARVAYDVAVQQHADAVRSSSDLAALGGPDALHGGFCAEVERELADLP